jgi:predicted porin
MGNTIVTEWGTAGAPDAADTPRAEGGFTREMGSFNYGLYMGNETSRISHAAGFLAQTNALDLMLAGDMGMKWGARLHYANRTDETGAHTKKNSALGVGLGVMQGDLGAYLNMDLNDKATGGTASADTSKLKPSFTLGASYMWSGYNFYAEYTAEKLDSTVSGTTTAKKDTTIVVGAGRTHEINPTSRVIYNAMLSMNTDENITGAGKTKTNKLPVTVALETEATSWLTLRGSISQSVLINEIKNTAGKKKTDPNTTDVAAGATLNFGKLAIDGTIGTTSAERSRNDNGSGTNESSVSESGVLTLDNLMTRVGLTYKF